VVAGRQNACIIAPFTARGIGVRILAFDCATIRCSAALWADGVVRAHEASEAAHGAAEALVPMLTRVLAAAETELRDADRLAITVGPGHFTGLRAGLAVARGLVLATGMEAVAVTTLEAVAASTDDAARRGRDVLVAIDSKRAEPFLQIFDEGLRPLCDPLSSDVEGFAAAFDRRRALLVAGDAGPRLIDALRRAGCDAVAAATLSRPDAAVVAALAAARKPLDGPVRPFYLHPPAVKLPAAAIIAGRS
jgi:tRNA threonylcarbamoyladenosine biosynthesis protein TsaB